MPPSDLLWSHSVMSNSVTPWTVGSSVHEIVQARILEWVPFPSPGDLPNPGIKPRSLALQADFFTVWDTRVVPYPPARRLQKGEFQRSEVICLTSYSWKRWLSLGQSRLPDLKKKIKNFPLSCDAIAASLRKLGINFFSEVLGNDSCLSKFVGSWPFQNWNLCTKSFQGYSLCPHVLQPARRLCPWDFPGKNTRVVGMSSSKGSSWPRDWTVVSCSSCIACRFFTSESPKYCVQSPLPQGTCILTEE